jgi:hypothetical protein
MTRDGDARADALHILQFRGYAPSPMEHGKIIERLGGYALLADALGHNISTVNRWQRSGIPAARWAAVLAVAKDKGWRLTLRDLHDGAPPHDYKGRGTRTKPKRPKRAKRQSETGTLSAAAA